MGNISKLFKKLHGRETVSVILLNASWFLLVVSFCPEVSITHADTAINSVMLVAFRFCSHILDGADRLPFPPLGGICGCWHCPVLHPPLPGVAFVCLISQEISNVSGV